MTKKISTFLLLSILLFTFISCGEGKAENVVKEYIHLIQNQDYTTAYSLISSKDKETTSLDDFISYYNNKNKISPSFIIHLLNLRNSTFTDLQAVKLDKTNYEVSVLAYSPIYTESFELQLKKDIEALQYSCNTIEGILELLEIEYKDTSFDTEEILYSYNVIKEDGKYKIFIDIM